MGSSCMHRIHTASYVDTAVPHTCSYVHTAVGFQLHAPRRCVAVAVRAAFICRSVCDGAVRRAYRRAVRASARIALVRTAPAMPGARIAVPAAARAAALSPCRSSAPRCLFRFRVVACGVWAMSLSGHADEAGAMKVACGR